MPSVCIVRGSNGCRRVCDKDLPQSSSDHAQVSCMGGPCVFGAISGALRINCIDDGDELWMVDGSRYSSFLADSDLDPCVWAYLCSNTFGPAKPSLRSIQVLHIH